MRWTAIALGCGALAARRLRLGGSAQSVQRRLRPGRGVQRRSGSPRPRSPTMSRLVLSGQGQPAGEPPAGLAGATTERSSRDALITQLRRGQRHRADRATQVEQGLERAGDRRTAARTALTDARPAVRASRRRPSRTSCAPTCWSTAIGVKLDAAGDDAAQLEAARRRSDGVLRRPSTSRSPRATAPGTTRSCRSSPARQCRRRPRGAGHAPRWAQPREDPGSPRRPSPERRAAARADRGHGPAALAGRLPVGRRADPRVAGLLPDRGGLRGRRGDRDRRPGGDARGARRRPAAGHVPLPDRPGAPEPTRGRSTTWPPASPPSWWPATRTSSATRRPTPPPTWSRCGWPARPRRSPASRCSTASPRGLPALLLAAKMHYRATHGGVAVPPPTRPRPQAAAARPSTRSARTGSATCCWHWPPLALDRGVDPESALRGALRGYAAAVRAAEGGPTG